MYTFQVLQNRLSGFPVDCLCEIQAEWLPNLRWQTFRYWAIRATDVYGLGSSPRGKWSIIVLALTSQIQPPTSPTFTSSSPSSISHHLHHFSSSRLVYVIQCVSLLSVQCNKNNKYQKERHVAAKPLYSSILKRIKMVLNSFSTVHNLVILCRYLLSNFKF